MATESRTSHRVVVALIDGKREKGFVYNFSPNAENFHLFPSESADRSFARLLDTRECKAIFFVKSHEGNKAYREAMRKVPEDPRKYRVRGHKMRIVFNDGEELNAFSEFYNPIRLGFFAYPLDPRSNNLRIFIINSNVRQVVTGQALQSHHRAGASQERVVKAGRSAGRPGAEAPARPALLAPPPSIDETSFPLEQRVEAVLRIIAGENPVALSEDLGVPAGVLAYWAQLFLQKGRSALGGAAKDASDERDALIAELAERVLALEEEVRRLRGVEGRQA